MSLFGSLKTTVNNIKSEVSEMKKVQPKYFFKTHQVFDPTPNIPALKSEEIKIKLSEMEFLVKNIRVPTSRFKAQFKKQIGITKNFCNDYEDFLLDVNSTIKNLEKKLVQYGYCPEYLDIQFQDDLENLDPAKNDGQKATKGTPKLIIIKRSADKERDKTPVLCLDPCNELIAKPKSHQPIIQPKSKSYALGEVARKLEF